MVTEAITAGPVQAEVIGFPGEMANASLIYRRDDPYSVRLLMDDGAGTDCLWVFARDLLFTGLADGMAGEADVQVLRESRRGTVVIRMESDEGVFAIRVPLPWLRSFITEIYCAVRPGQETDHLDLDLELAQLLKDEGAL